MSYNFKNLADIELLTEVPETANKIIEVDGSIKRVPNKEVSGEEFMIKTAWIRQIYDPGQMEQPVGYSSMVPSFVGRYECFNMSFNEAINCLKNGEPLACYLTVWHGNNPSTVYKIQRYGTIIYDVNSQRIMIQYIDPINGGPAQIFWDEDGIYNSSGSGDD